MSRQLNIRVTPRASKNQIIPLGDDSFKVRLTAAPVDGRANKALIKLLTKEFGVSPSRVRIVKGTTSRNKVVEIATAERGAK